MINVPILYTRAEKRGKYWDVVKGIGIISIILGHSCWFSVKWVYSYHWVLFSLLQDTFILKR